jgi:hypothetical protein
VNYNLLEEKWLPVLWKNGNTNRVDIIEALTQADRIRQIAANNPMDRVAILRFLLVLLYWCKGNPPDKIPDDSFPPEWFEKLKDNKDSFDLLGKGKRFYQDHTAKRKRAVTDLIQEIPAGNNFWHFRHSTDKKNGLCPSCCAMGLLRLPLFSVSGLSGPGEPNLMAGINGVPPVYIVPWGNSLFNTLTANWVACTNIGEPSWVQPRISQIQNEDVPLLTGLTLLPRRVLLHYPVKEPAICISCAENTALILTCEFQTAGKKENQKWNDPHVIYLDGKTRKTLRAADLTSAGKFRMDHPWPDLLARIVETGKTTPLLVIGFATNKAKNVDVWERIIDMPSTGPIPKMAAPLIRQWQEKGKEMEKKVGRSKVEGPAFITSVRPHIEGRVSAKAGELIIGGEDAWEQAAREYGPMMAAIAKSLSPGYTTAALQRRNQIADAKPNMRPNTTTKKSSRKKGGDK